MRSSKWFAPLLPYLAVWIGMFLLKNAWYALLGFHAMILLVLLIARPEIPVNILFKYKNLNRLILGVLVCVSSGILLYYLRAFFITTDLSSQLASLGLNKSTWPGFIVYFSLVNPWIEEYFWRAYLGSETRGFYISDLIYAGYHGLVLFGKINILMIFLIVGCLTVVGWLWRQVSRIDGGLLAPALAHMAADFSILFAVCWMTI